MISSIIFILFFLAGTIFFTINVRKVRRNILLGKDINRKDKISERIKIMTLVAFGQKKMFARPVPALLHLFLYAAFVITQIELIEIIWDGASGSH
ncbi:MAG: Fe-S oxidoreductase, partial [Bacteroidia bacterium]